MSRTNFISMLNTLKAVRAVAHKVVYASGMCVVLIKFSCLEIMWSTCAERTASKEPDNLGFNLSSRGASNEP